MNTNTFRLIAAAACLSLASVPAASAGMVTWDVDSSSSFIRLTIPDQVSYLDTLSVTIRIRNASSSTQWTDAGGRRATIDGTLQTDFVDGVSVEFLTGAHSLFALEETSLRPNPAAFDPLATSADNPNGSYSDTTTAPAALGGRLIGSTLLLTADAAFLALHNVLFDLESDVVPLAGGTIIGANSTSFGMDSASLSVDAVPLIGGIGQPVPDMLNLPLSLDNAINIASGSVTNEGGLLRKLSLNVSAPLALDINGTVLNGTLSGTIVAYATIPEPSTITLVGLALLGLGVRTLTTTRRRLRREPARSSAAP